MLRTAPWRRHYRIVVAVLAGMLCAGASLVSSARMSALDGLLYDMSLAVTAHRPGGGGEPVAVVALDRGSLDSPELAAIPRVFFAPFWAKLIDGLSESGVKALGFDIIFAYSANRFPASDGRYDQPFLTALQRAHKIVVLARSAEEVPAFPFVAAVFDPADAGKQAPGGIANTEMFPDADGVQRRLGPSLVTTGGKALPTMTSALLARAGGPPMPPLLLAPARPLEAIPSYRLIDVLRCLDSDRDAVRRAFAGKIVLVGTTLPDEDRKRTPDRFMTAPQPHPAGDGGCSLDRLGASDASAHTVPGVFVHAAAIEQVLTGNLVRPLPPAPRAVVAAVAGVAGALLGFALAPWLAFTASMLLALALFGIALAALPLGFWFPVAIPSGGGWAGMVAAYVARFVAEERRRRRVQRAFGHYLAPSLVDRLADSEAELRLGGERREVTVMFADLSGFTALSGRMGPEELTEVTNRYLGLIVAAVEATGGYVDKFIGDAVMGIWGAPATDSDHAANAARAALAAVAAVAAAKAEADVAGQPGYAVKIGLNSGPAVVGNVGAPGRYNYTAIGETVNIAARLESVPGDYGCAIVVGPETAAAITGRFVTCELDWIRLKGKDEPLAVYELLAARDTASPDELAYPTRYAAALVLYRIGDFAAAETAWRGIGYPRTAEGTASPPQIMAARCAELRVNPPADWDGTFVKTTK